MGNVVVALSLTVLAVPSVVREGAFEIGVEVINSHPTNEYTESCPCAEGIIDCALAVEREILFLKLPWNITLEGVEGPDYVNCKPNVNAESSINFGNEEEPAPYNIPNSVCPSDNCNGVTGCLLNYALQPANGSVLQMTLNLKYDKGEEVPDGRPAERGTEPFELLYEIVPLKLGDYPRCDIKNEGNEASGSILIPVACGLDEMELYKKGGSFQKCEACLVAVDESASEEGCVCPDGYEEYDKPGQCIKRDSDGGSAAVRGPFWV